MKLEKPNVSEFHRLNNDELNIYKKVNQLYVELVSLAAPDKISSLYKNEKPDYYSESGDEGEEATY